MSSLDAKSILVIVPNQQRDLFGHALVGYHLQKSFGDRVTFTNGLDIEQTLQQVRPDVLVLDQLAWDYRVRAALCAKRLGARVVLLPTSGLFQKADQHRYLELAGCKFRANQLIDLFLAWGEETRTYLIKEGVLSESTVVTVGSPRFDFYVSPLLDLLQSKSELFASLRIKASASPLVLWTPNNASYGKLNADGMERWAVGTRMNLDDIRLEMEDIVTQQREHSQILLEWARLRPDWHFITKIHPSDRSDSYRWMEGEVRNLSVVTGMPIHSLLRHCDVLVHRYSTTANEAWILQKTVLLLDIGTYNIPLDEDFIAGCDIAHSLAMADTIVAQRLQGCSPIPDQQLQARKRLIAQNYYRVDGQSAERSARAIHDAAQADSEQASKKAARVIVGVEDGGAKFASRWAQRVKRSLLGGGRAVSRSHDDEVMRTSVNELYARFDGVFNPCRGEFVLTPAGREETRISHHE